MFEMIYKIWCITDDFFAQFIVFNNGDLDDDDAIVMDDYNLHKGYLANDKATQT